MSVILLASAVEAPRRISSVEVEGIKLEIEQPTHQSKLLIRVNDGRASAQRENEVVVSVWYARRGDREEQIADVVLKRVDTGSFHFEYWGEFVAGKEFSHGAIGKVIYQSEALPFPISTWIWFYYH